VSENLDPLFKKILSPGAMLRELMADRLLKGVECPPFPLLGGPLSK
jgi:hypothetical protein